jgi:uncharacterized membrane protein HdeD (DUF308 family)
MLANLTNTVMGVLIFIGYYLIIEGIIKLSQAYLQKQAGANFWHPLLGGLLAIALGVLVFTWPRPSVVIILALIATHAIFQGVSDIIAANQTKPDLRKSWYYWSIIAGIAQIIFGIWMVFQPIIGGFTVIIVIGIYAIVVGIVLIIRAFQARSGGGPKQPAAAY